MRTATLLRSGPAAWTGLLLLPALIWFGARNASSAIGSWESATAQSLVVLGFVNAACGACAAWESARIHRAEVDLWAPARTRLAMAWLHAAPITALGLLGLLSSLAVFSGEALGAPGFPSLLITVTALTVVLSHIALGWAVGALMPRVLGAAAMLVFGYLWGFWPSAIGELPWLRHLGAQAFAVCCGLDQVASVRSLAATLLFSAGIVAAVLISLLLDRARRGRLVLISGPAVLGLVGSLALAVPLEFQGTQARDPGLRRCAGEQVKICAWPEQYEHQDDMVRWARDAERLLRAVGVRPASLIEFGSPHPGEGEVRATTATSALPAAPPACAMERGAEYPGDAAHTVLYAWLSLTAGEPRNELSRRWPADAVDLAGRVRELPTAGQRAWYQRNMRSVLDCSVRPALDPDLYRDVRGRRP